MMKLTGRVVDKTTGGGIEGVLVTNGEHVARTGTDGGYALEVEPGGHSFITLTVPDTMKAVDGFFRHLGDGATDPGSVNFQLEPAPEREATSFRFAQVTDTHVVVDQEKLSQRDVLAEALQQLEGEASPDFVIVSGDLTNLGRIDELTDFQAALSEVQVPVYLLFGGHDGNEERRGSDTPGISTFTRNYETVLGPTYFSFDWGGLHFAVYPNEEHFFSTADQQRKRTWLQADLAAAQVASRPSVVIVHIPPPMDFLDELIRLGVELVLHGHWHSSKAFSHGGLGVAATPPLCFGGIDTSPRSYRVIEQRPDGKHVDQRALGFDRGSLVTPRELAGGQYALAWQTDIPGGIHRATPVVAGDTLLVSLRDENLRGEAGVLCLTRDDGEVAWKTPTDSSVKNSVALSPDGNRAAALSVAGRLHVVDTASGQVLWTADLPGFPERWLFISPVIADGRVFAGGKAGYGAFDLDTGDELWYSALDGSDAWSCYAGPVVGQENDLLIVPLQRRGIVALRRGDGQIAWETEISVDYQCASLVPAGERLIVACGGGVVISLRVAATGVEEKERDSVFLAGDSYASGLAAAGSRLFATTPSGYLRCCDLETRDALWSISTGPDLLDMTPYKRGVSSVLSTPVEISGRVVVGANDGVLYIAESATGRCVGREAFGAPISAAVALADDGFFVGTWDGRLCRYRQASP